MVMRIVMTKRNRESKYPVYFKARVADHHNSVILAYMDKFNINKSEAIRMIIEEAARRLLEEEY